jgi:NAD(P)-dependent dehydrogenase (short-subunit alcohol dehydrogenase family)
MGLQRIGWGIGVAAGGVMLARAVKRWQRRIDFGARVAIVTGGSRGLGLALARELASEGAEVVLVARSAGDLEDASADLLERCGREPFIVAADVGQPGAMEEVVEQVLHRFGRIDLLINAAGVMQVGPIQHMDRYDFARAMATHFWGPLLAMTAVIPVLRRQGGGRIVNISSIGGRIAIPHMLPYCASKFALVGLSDGMGAELARDGIRVTTVCPSLLRTGSHMNIQVVGRHREEFTWFAVGASLPLLSMSARRAARRILEACRHGDRHLDLGWVAKLASVVHGVAPGLVAELMAAGAHLLPPPAAPEEGDVALTGWDSRSSWVPSRLTRSGNRAVRRHNQMRGHRPEDLGPAR